MSVVMITVCTSYEMLFFFFNICTKDAKINAFLEEKKNKKTVKSEQTQSFEV